MRRLLPGGAPVPLDELYLDLEPRSAESGRPAVLLGMVASLDGVVAVEGRSGPLGGEADLTALRRLREQADVVLVGAATVRAERYGPVRLPAAAEQRRAAAGRPTVPTLAIVTRTGDLGAAAEGLTGAPGVMLIAPEGAPLPDLGSAGELRSGGGSVDLDEALRLLHARGADTVVCEGGPDLAGQLLAAELVDELFVTVAPRLVGAGPHLLDEALDDPGELQLLTVHEHAGELLLRYRVTAASR